MNIERWRKIQKLFEEAVDLHAAERERFLQDNCGNDLTLLAEVQSLINADNKQHSLLDNRASDFFDLKSTSAQVGQMVGPYRTIKQIASGGMGAVYLAERADGQFTQQVALKLIKRGMDSEEILRRFRGERQILAGLNHPNVSRLIDGGLTDEGLPWFSMEYVDGEPIDSYCDSNQLTIEERLKLFLTVCRTVGYAQQNLVVHRDLKPSNILVTKEGTVKLLDFGIAKLLDTASVGGEPASVTQTGFRVMTPGFASPEQVRGDNITTASDVYSLGIVLYYLLTGSAPYQLTNYTSLEMEKIICSTDPLRPSAAVTERSGKPNGSFGDTPYLANVCQARRTQPGRLRRLLAGDLDNICLMALRKEPQRRYQSAGQLAEDIRRYLNGLPVVARKASLGYRGRKFFDRNRLAVLVTLAIVVIIPTLVGFYTIRLAQERDRARIEAAKAAEISDFLTSLFTVADPNESKGETVTARELLRRGAERVEAELQDQPLTQAALLAVIGNVHIQLGLPERADTLLTRALTLRVEGLGFYHPDVSASIRDLAMVAYNLGEYHRSETLYRQALEIDQKLFGEEHATVAEDMSDLAAALKRKGERDEALVLQEKALDLRIRLYGEMHPDVAHSMNHLGGLLHETGEDDKAEQLLRRGLEIRRSLYDSNHVEVVASMGKLASFLVDKGHLEEAERLYLGALTILNRLVGENHHYIGGVVGNLGNLYLQKGEISLADSLFRRSLEILRATLPEGHVGKASPLVGLAQARIAEGNFEEAASFLQEALSLQENSLSPHHWRIARAQALLGLCLLGKSEFIDAETMLMKSLPILVENRGTRDKLTQQIADSLIDLSDRLGRHVRADSLRVLFNDRF